MVSKKMMYVFLFWKFSLSVAMATKKERQPMKFSSLDKIHIFATGLLKEHFCKTFVKVSAVRNKGLLEGLMEDWLCQISYTHKIKTLLTYLLTSHYKSMETISCHSDESTIFVAANATHNSTVSA